MFCSFSLTLSGQCEKAETNVFLQNKVVTQKEAIEMATFWFNQWSRYDSIYVDSVKVWDAVFLVISGITEF